MAEPGRGPIMDLLTEMDQLEELLEDMAEAGVRSVDEIEARIALLDARLGDVEESEAGPMLEPPAS